MPSMPDFTPAQFVAVIGQIIAVAVAYGVDVTQDEKLALLALAGTIGAVLIWADMRIRKHRAENIDKISNAK